MSVTFTSRVTSAGGGGVGQAAATTTSGMTTKPAFSETSTGKVVLVLLMLGAVAALAYESHQKRLQAF